MHLKNSIIEFSEWEYMYMLKKRKLNGITAFNVVNGIIQVTAAVVCVIPFLNAVALSFSSKSSAAAGMVGILPVDFTFMSYEYVLEKKQFWDSALVSLMRVILGGVICMTVVVLAAYPLSRPKKDFRGQKFFMWYMIIPMLFNGGLIPTYLVVKTTGLLNSIWALILPISVPVFNVILLMNFFRQIPNEIDEAAFVDGANHWRILVQIYLPLTKPALATIALMVFVTHWNSWFDGMIYMNDVSRYPLQTYIRSITTMPKISSMDENMVKLLQMVSDRTMRSAQIVIGSIPVLMVYPFLQRYFVKGLVLGGVKG